MIAVDYGNVYVAQVAMGANPLQTLKAFHEAESYPGPSLILAYSHCIAHGIDMSTAMSHQKEAVDSGYWPLYRYDPRLARRGRAPVPPRQPQADDPPQGVRPEGGAVRHAGAGQPRAGASACWRWRSEDVDERWRFYEQMAGVERTVPDRWSRRR